MERDDALGRKPPVSTRSIETQTDVTRNTLTVKHPSKTSFCYCRKDKESEKCNRLLLMHSNLLRRHEKEVQLNVQHMETVAALTLQVSELEQQLVGLRSQQQTHAPETSVDHRQQPLISTSSTQLCSNAPQCQKRADTMSGYVNFVTSTTD